MKSTEDPKFQPDAISDCSKHFWKWKSRKPPTVDSGAAEEWRDKFHRNQKLKPLIFSESTRIWNSAPPQWSDELYGGVVTSTQDMALGLTWKTCNVGWILKDSRRVHSVGNEERADEVAVLPFQHDHQKLKWLWENKHGHTTGHRIRGFVNPGTCIRFNFLGPGSVREGKLIPTKEKSPPGCLWSYLTSDTLKSCGWSRQGQRSPFCQS